MALIVPPGSALESDPHRAVDTTALSVFQNDEFQLQIQPDGDSFVIQASGLAAALGFHEGSVLVRTLPDHEKCKIYVDTPGGRQEVWFVREPGFYRALGQRQAARIKDETFRAQVKRFQDWVYGEVLPAIRKIGRYELPAEAPDELELAERYVVAIKDKRAAQARAVEAERERDAATAHAAELAPRARSWDVLASAAGDYAVLDAAQLLARDPHIETGEIRLFAKLDQLGWIYRHRGDRRWRPYQSTLDAGRMSSRAQSHDDPNTGDRVVDAPQVRVTVKGLHDLHKIFGGSVSIERHIAAHERDRAAEPSVIDMWGQAG